MALKPPRPGVPTRPIVHPVVHDDMLRHAAFELESSRPADAERLADSVLKRRPNDPQALQILVAALFAQGRAQEAIPKLEKAAQRTRNPVIETQLAIVLSETGRGDDAIEWLTRASERRPVYPPAFLELGIQLMALRRIGDAVAALRRGCELAPGFAELSIRLGKIYADRRDLDAARDAFTRALQSAPGHPEVMLGLAQLLEMSGAFTQAVDLYRPLLKTKYNVAARIGLGACLLELGETEDAFKNFRAASAHSAKAYGQAVIVTAAAGRGRLWLRPSAAERFFHNDKK
jgi:tetratricopeptide (TPR) repeat protein